MKTEFRNTHFSYFMGVDGVEKFVLTPELHSDEAIEADPLPPGQVWGDQSRRTGSGPGALPYRSDLGAGQRRS